MPIIIHNSHKIYSTGTATSSGITKLYTSTGSATDGAMTQSAITTALNGKATSVHTHNYAGASSSGGSATSAVKLDTATAGSTTQPVYFSGGKPVACAYTLGKSVPSNAVFTDTNTWRGIQNNLTSDSTSDSLSAAQGKVLKKLVDGKAEKSHTHTKSQITDFPTSLKNPSSLTIQLNGTTNATYDGSNAKTVNITPSSIGAALSSHTHNYAGASSSGGSATSALKLSTARTIELNGLSSGSVSFDGSNNATITNWGYGWSKTVTSSTADKPYIRIATTESKSNYYDASIVFVIDSGYQGGGFGVVKVCCRTNNISKADQSTCEVIWLVRQGFSANQLFVKGNAPSGDTQYFDLYFKASGTYNGATITVLSSCARGVQSRKWTFLNDAARTAADTRKYTFTTEGSDVGSVKSASSSSKANGLNDTNNNSTITAAYSKSGLAYADYSWLTAWNGYELRAVAKSQFATADHSHNLNTMINGLSTGTSAPQDADYYICQYVGGGTTTTTYHRRPHSALWSYVKGKTDSIYAAKSHTHNSVTDINDSKVTTFAYSKASLDYNNFTYLAAWNGYELRAINKSAFATAGHTHKYAGSSSVGGSATSAVKLDTATAGSTTQPVYFSGGKPVACTYTLGKSVPSDAKFTDTNTWRGVQNNLTSTATDQSLSAAQGKVLKSLVDGKANSNHTHSYLPLSGGTLSGDVAVNKDNIYCIGDVDNRLNTLYTFYIDTQYIDAEAVQLWKTFKDKSGFGTLKLYTANKNKEYYYGTVNLSCYNGPTSSGEVMIIPSTAVPYNNVYLTCPKTSGTLQVATSDIRLKENIEYSTTNALSLLNNIKVRQFDWKDGKIHQNIGFVADELEELDKNLAVLGDDELDDNGYPITPKGVNTFYLQGYEVKAIQELSEKNNQLENTIQLLKSKIESLENKIK